jgi:hypothetical protein
MPFKWGYSTRVNADIILWGYPFERNFPKEFQKILIGIEAI